MEKSFNLPHGMVLDVPFKDKDQAKELGAWWDPEIRKWYVPRGKDPKPFARWFPKQDAKASEDDVLTQ